MSHDGRNETESGVKQPDSMGSGDSVNQGTTEQDGSCSQNAGANSRIIAEREGGVTVEDVESTVMACDELPLHIKQAVQTLLKSSKAE